MDFLISKAGDENVSNSFNPRMRHACEEWDRLLVGQTWSTFMIVVVPDEIDFAGILDDTQGAFHRIQFAVKYVFGYDNTVADEKR